MSAPPSKTIDESTLRAFKADQAAFAELYAATAEDEANPQDVSPSSDGTILRPDLTPDELSDARLAWQLCHVGKPISTQLRAAATKAARYAIAHAYHHEERATERPLFIHPDGAREGHPGVLGSNHALTVRQLRDWLDSNTARPAEKASGPFLAPGHTSVIDTPHQREEKNCTAIGWLFLDADGVGDWHEAVGAVAAHRGAYVHSRSSGHCPKGCEAHPTGAIKWHLVLPLRKAWTPEKSTEAARARWKGLLYPAARFALHLLGDLSGKGFDPPLSQMLCRFYPGAPTPQHAGVSRELRGCGGLGFDVEACAAALIDLGVIEPEAVRERAERYAESLDEGSGQSGASDQSKRSVWTGGPSGDSDPPTVQAFTAAGLYIRRMANGKHAVVCPWEHLHSPGKYSEDDTVLFSDGHFHCGHSHPEGHGKGATVRAVKALPFDAQRVHAKAMREMPRPDTQQPAPPAVLILDDLIARVKADPHGHLDPEVIASALALSPRDLDTLVEILRTNDRSLRPFNAALSQARKEARAAKKAAALSSGSPRPATDAPQILVHEKELQVADQAIAALSADTTIYQRARMLVRVAVDGNRDLPPAIEALPEHTLRERLSECVNWVREVVNDEGEKKLIPEHPPSWAVKAILSRGEWAGLRNLTAVTGCPLMRPDGTVLSAPGYDAATGYLFIPTHGVAYPAVPDRPTDAEVQAALDLLLEPIADFEFDTLGPFNAENTPEGSTPEEQNRRMNVACALAMILTLLARPAIKGPVPLGAFNACTPGTGKTLLCRVVVYIGTGLEMVTSTCTEDPDEDRKAALGHLMAGEKCVVFDNVAGELGNGVIDALVTAWPTFSGRELGKNNSPKVPALTFWLATGNNLRIHDDTVRRTLRSSLRSTYDDPSDRDPDSFRHGNLMEWVEANRPQLVTAALTILRGWVVDGRPRQKLRPWPSFEAWGAIVPQVLAWLGFPDIGRSQVDLQKTNEAASGHAKLVRGWEKVCTLECAAATDPDLVGLSPPPAPVSEPKSAIQVLALLRKPEHAEVLAELREAIEELANGRSPEKIGHIGLGRIIGRFKGRVCMGKAIFPARVTANNAWEVRRVRDGSATGTPAVSGARSEGDA